MTELDDRLARLPDSLSTPLRHAIEVSGEVGEEYDEALEARSDEAWQAALSAAGFSKSEGYVQRAIPLASELSEDQRAVVEVLAHVPGLPLNDWPIYTAAWLRRRWLGIDEPGPLFGEIEHEGRSLPLIHVLRELVRGDREFEARELIMQRSLAERIELLVDLSLADLDIELLDMSELIENVTLELADLQSSEGVAAWTVPSVERLFESFARPFALGERPHGEMPDLIARMALTSLLAAGIPLEPRHDALLRLGWGDFEALALRSIAAIPEPRREAAVLAALERLSFPNYRIRVSTMLLREFPLVEVARYALAQLGRIDNPAGALELFDRLAAQHPSLAAVVTESRANMPEVPKLHLGPVLQKVTLADLDDVRRRQLEIANERYGGQLIPVEAIFEQSEEDGDGETITPDFLELRTILGDDDEPRYDAWLYNVDSGTIFVTGTEEVVAEVIQFGVETDDPGLRIALPAVLEEVPKQVTGKKKAAAKKKPAKKKPAAKKKAAAKKKPAAKKPAAKKKAAAAKKKPAAKKKAAAKKPAAKKKAAAKKPAAKKKAAAKKPAAKKKAAAKKPAAKKR